MSIDKNHINYSAEDIRRYWQNQMSAAEMHALEKAAMEDPFLADAMEGYSKVSEDQEANLAALRTRIRERTGSGAVISIKRKNYVWRVAAAFVIIAGLGTLTVRYVTDSNKRDKSAMAKTEIPLPPPSAQTEQDSADSAKSIIAADTIRDMSTNNSVLSNKTSKNISAKDKTVMQSGIASVERDSNAFLAISTPQVINEREKEEAARNVERLEGRAAGIKTDDRGAMQSRSNALLFNNFTGRVVDPQNNGIPMANVRMNNANVALTDQNGNFQFKSFDTVANVSIVSSGYAAREVNLAGNRGPEPIVLQAENDKQSKLSEVNTSPKKKAQTETKDLKVYINDAQPVTGWKEFEDYLEKNKKLPSKEGAITGEVVVTFKVDREGKLSSFNIERSLSKIHDAEAIRLIKEGPAWMVTKGKKPRVKVIVKF